MFEQWGNFVSTYRADRIETITFNLSFSTGCYKIIAIQRIANPNNHSGGNLQIQSQTKNSATLWFDYYTDSIDYIALGK